MAETCVLGHAWTQGRVLCPVCGFGPRAVPAGATTQVAPTAQSAPLQRVAAPVPVAQAVSVSVGGGAPERVLSPDGQWAWDGTQWQPTQVAAPPVAPAAASVTGSVTTSVTTSVTESVTESVTAPVTAPPAAERASHAASGRRVDPRLLLMLVVVIAAAAAADFFLKLPPLGHKSAAAPAVVVVHHSATSGRPGRASAAVDGDLARVAAAEARVYGAAHTFTADAAVLRRAGATETAGDHVLVAAKGLGYCAVVGTPGSWYALNSHFAGILGTVVYATPAAAEATCPTGLGAFHTL